MCKSFDLFLGTPLEIKFADGIAFYSKVGAVKYGGGMHADHHRDVLAP